MFREFLLVLVTAAFVKGQCTIRVNTDITDPQPLVLRTGNANGNDAYHLPTNGDAISIAQNGIVVVACPNARIVISGSATTLESSQATCSSGRFSINGQSVPFSAITCSAHAAHSARLTGGTCLNGNREFEIGFPIGSRFIRHILGCFNPNDQSTLYTEFDLTSSICGYQVNYPRPNWVQGSGFFSVGSSSVDSLYTRNNQRTTINALLGLGSSDATYIHGTNDYFLSRGHLVAKADFVFGSQHRFTFYFANAAPQWQTFNGGNWNTLEDNVRNLACNRRLNLKVYTGTYGVTTLPHASTGAAVSLFLYVSGNNRGIPVPELFWKIVYNPATRAGVAFVGVNNPYKTSITPVCTNICNQITYLSWRPNDQKAGFSYCCTVDDLRRTVPNIPSFTVNSVLT